MLNRNIQLAVKYLNLQRPIKIVCGQKMKMDDAAADYIALYKNGGKGVLHSHRIRVCLDAILESKPGDRELGALIIHELIHAAQEEKKLKEYHGKFFRKHAKVLERITGVSEIYIPGTDT